MTIPSKDLASLLDDALDWDVFYSKKPTTPDNLVICHDTGGFPSNPRFLMDSPTVQIEIRGNKDEYDEAMGIAEEVHELLLGHSQVTINGTLYVGIWSMGRINDLGRDDNDRPLLSTNWRMITEPAVLSPSNRDPL